MDRRTSSTGQTGLSLVLTLVARLLDPSASESGGIFVGDLVIHLLRKAGGAMGDILPGLLEAFVVRLASAETASFSQVRLYYLDDVRIVLMDPTESRLAVRVPPSFSDRDGPRTPRGHRRTSYRVLASSFGTGRPPLQVVRECRCLPGILESQSLVRTPSHFPFLTPA